MDNIEELPNNNTVTKLVVDDKGFELAVEDVNGNYYVYRDGKKKLNNKRDKDDIIILEGELEDELRRLWVDG